MAKKFKVGDKVKFINSQFPPFLGTTGIVCEEKYQGLITIRTVTIDHNTGHVPGTYLNFESDDLELINPIRKAHLPKWF